jgi:hypothetical protein
MRKSAKLALLGVVGLGTAFGVNRLLESEGEELSVIPGSYHYDVDSGSVYSGCRKTGNILHDVCYKIINGNGKKLERWANDGGVELGFNPRKLRYVNDYRECDIWLEHFNSYDSRINATNGAVISSVRNLDFDSIEIDDLKQLKYSEEGLDNLQDGNIFSVLSGDGDYGIWEVKWLPLIRNGEVENERYHLSGRRKILSD